LSSEVIQRGLGARTVLALAFVLVLVAGALVATGRSHAVPAAGLSEWGFRQTACSVAATCEGPTGGISPVISIHEPLVDVNPIPVGVEGATIGRQDEAVGATTTYQPSAPEVVSGMTVASSTPAVTVTLAASGVTGNDPETWVTQSPHFLTAGDQFNLNIAIATGGGSCTAGLVINSTVTVSTVLTGVSFQTTGTALNCAAGASTATSITHGVLITTSAAHGFSAGSLACIATGGPVTLPTISGDHNSGFAATCPTVSLINNATAFTIYGVKQTAAGAVVAIDEGDAVGVANVTVSGGCGVGALAVTAATLGQTLSDGVRGFYSPLVIFATGAATTCEIDTVGNAGHTPATNTQVQIVGAATALAQADPHAAFGTATRGGAPIAGAVSANKVVGGTNLLNAAAGAALLGREFTARATDANNQPVLRGDGGGATIAAGGLFANGLGNTVMTSYDAVATVAACAAGCYAGGFPAVAPLPSFGPPGAGTAIPAGNYGWFFVAVTAASLAVGDTHTLTITSGTATPLVITFTTFGAAAEIIVTAPAGAGAGDANISPNGAGTNIYGAWGIQVNDANGVGVPGIAAGTFTVTNNAANPGAMVFGAANNAGAAQAPDVAPVALAGVAGVPGAYTVFIGAGALTAAGTYSVDANIFLGGVLPSLVETFTINVGGAAATGVASVGDVASGTSGLSTAGASLAAVGPNESVPITFTFTDAAGNSVPGGSAVAIATTAGVGSIIPAGAQVTTNGAATWTFVAPNFSGTQTVTAQQGAIVSQVEIEVGGTGGGNPDAISVVGDAEIDADTGALVAVSFLVERDGAAVDDALVRFDTTCGETSPDETDTTADGLATTTFQSNSAGTCMLTAQVYTLGLGGTVIPTDGLEASITINVGGSVLSLVAGGQFVFASFSGTASEIFGANTTIVWKFLGVDAGWVSYFADVGVENFSVAPGDVLWVVSPIDQDLSVN